ncbi:MAG: hypothetical protein SFH39_04155 [Candidatus Magnetobacterium sp. LHC-1]|nr:hypothetical protein [Nitrospirota bacterium]
MERLRHNVLYGVAGFLGGIGGILPLSRCSGGTCSACFGCAGFGIVIVAMALFKKQSKEDG